ncbi:DUF7004 family protein [Carboxylicivirga taeanensis]|uniref:DUF7004 family protein n=1 Tax=Carboxylicivirga taeanensis TaxID=1416875 RepID=UPI003F6DF038
MAILVKSLKNNRKVVFDRGKFDEWCVFLVDETSQTAPLDIEYFTQLKLLSYRYPQGKIYNDFLVLYRLAQKEPDNTAATVIDQLAQNYKWNDALLIEQWLTVLYAGMVAEENKKNAILKKRIKRLGMYQLFFLNFSAEEAASFSKNKTWRELDKHMQTLGF